MAETKTILVAGATGQQGGTVARSLLKRGHPVIGLTRSASKLKGLAAAGPEHDRATCCLHGQLREPLDDIVPPARDHGGSSPSDDASTARGGEGHRGVRCPGIRRPEGGHRQDRGTRGRRLGLRRPPGGAVEETRTSDSICRAARGRGPEENGRRRIPDVPVLQDGRIPRRHPRTRGRLGLPHDPAPRVPRRRGLAAPRLRPVAYRAVERPDSRSFCAAACGSSRRAATSSGSFLNARPKLGPSETRRTRRRWTFPRSLSRARPPPRSRRPPLWSRYNACFSIAPATSSIPRPSRAAVRMIGGVHPSRVSSWNFRLSTRTSSLPRSTLFTT